VIPLLLSVNARKPLKATCILRQITLHVHSLLPGQLSAVEFTRRCLRHILPKGFVKARYYGGFSNTKRKSYIERCRQLPGLADDQSPSGHEPQLATDSAIAQPFRFRDDPSKGIAIRIEAQTGDVGDSFESHCRSTSNRGQIPAWHVADKPVGGRDGCRNHDGPSCYIAIFDRPSLAIAQVPGQSPSEKPFGSEDGR
jgi:hypothetical protein